MQRKIYKRSCSPPSNSRERERERERERGCFGLKKYEALRGVGVQGVMDSALNSNYLV